MASPIAARRLFFARFARTLGSASWMVVIFMAPVLIGVGVGRCAPYAFYATMIATIIPFSIIPVALGSACTLFVVNVFPARRARDLLMLMGLVFAAAVVLLLRFIQPERLLRVESLPDITDFFATLQSPVTPMLPSFWAGETLFAAVQGGFDWLHQSALWTTAGAFTVMLGAAHGRWHFAGYSRSQEAPKTRFAHFRTLDLVAAALPLSPVRRQLLVKDVKIFLRDVSQWVQLLPLLALVLLYLYNFRVLDLDRIPYMSGFIKNVYAFINLGMAGFVMATVAVRFVFPAVSAEGSAFWIIRTSPDLDARLPVVEVLDGAAARVPLHRGADDRGQSTSRCRSVPEAGRGGGDRLSDVRACRSRLWPRRALPTLQRRRDAGCRLVRRRHVHDRSGRSDHRHRRSRGLALVDVFDVAKRSVPLPPDARATGDDRGQFHCRRARSAWPPGGSR